MLKNKKCQALLIAASAFIGINGNVYGSNGYGFSRNGLENLKEKFRKDHQEALNYRPEKTEASSLPSATGSFPELDQQRVEQRMEQLAQDKSLKTFEDSLWIAAQSAIPDGLEQVEQYRNQRNKAAKQIIQNGEKITRIAPSIAANCVKIYLNVCCTYNQNDENVASIIPIVEDAIITFEPVYFEEETGNIHLDTMSRLLENFKLIRENHDDVSSLLQNGLTNIVQGYIEQNNLVNNSEISPYLEQLGFNN